MTIAQSAEKEPLVSVIIPVYNDSENLRKCLFSLQRQTYPADRVEIIVVDNGSDEKLHDLETEFEEAIFLDETAPGSYAARNKGISIAKGDILAFIDSDIVADPEWLRNGIDALYSQPNIGSVGGKVDFSFRNEDQPSSVELYDSLTSFKQKDYIEKNHFSGAGNLFTFPDVFEKVGLFNKNLKSGGDCEWGNRVYAAGYQLVYADDACVYHPARTALVQLLKKHRRVASGNTQKMKSGDGCWYGKFVRAQMVEVLMFLIVCRDIALSEKVSFFKIPSVIAIAALVSFLRMVEPYRILLGGTATR